MSHTGQAIAICEPFSCMTSVRSWGMPALGLARRARPRVCRDAEVDGTYDPTAHRLNAGTTATPASWLTAVLWASIGILLQLEPPQWSTRLSVLLPTIS